MTAKTASARRTRATKPEDEVDLEAILPNEQTVVLDGIECRVRHLKAREFFQLMGVVTSTLGPEAGTLFSQMGDADKEEFSGHLLGVVVATVPHAIDPLLRVLANLVEPLDGELEHDVREYMKNPEVEDLFPIVDAVIENEKDNIWSLVGKAKTYLGKWKNVVAQGRGRPRST